MTLLQNTQYVRYEDENGDWHTALFETEDAREAFTEAYDGVVEHHEPLSVRYAYDEGQLTDEHTGTTFEAGETNV